MFGTNRARSLVPSLTDPVTIRQEKRRVYAVVQAILEQAGQPEHHILSIRELLVLDDRVYWTTDGSSLRDGKTSTINIFPAELTRAHNHNEHCDYYRELLVRSYARVIGEAEAQRLIKCQVDYRGWRYVQLCMPDRITLDRLVQWYKPSASH